MRFIFRTFILISFCVALAACSGKQVAPQNENDAAKYFQEGERQFEKKLYTDAIASWEKVRDTFYSPELSMLAEIKIADAYYISGKFSEAAAAYQDFLDHHTTDPRESDLLFRLGLSYYRQILSADRDQTNTENAFKTMQKLVDRYPQYPKIDEARTVVLRCITRLAEHEVYVGHFYLKKEQLQPAIKRLNYALTKYPDYYYKDEAYFYLLKAYLLSDQRDKAEEFLQKLVKEYPQSDLTQEARELIAES